jgi:hypothetical protein
MAKGGFYLQEDIERRSIAVSVNATKLTGRVLAKALSMIANKIKHDIDEAQTPHGKQSVKKLMNHGVATNSIALDGGKKETELFDRMARKYNVDYAFHKTAPNKYLLFFKAGQADAITVCFSEYSKHVIDKGARGMAKGAKDVSTKSTSRSRPSILKQLKKFADIIKSRTKEPKQRERTREAGHER